MLTSDQTTKQDRNFNVALTAFLRLNTTCVSHPAVPSSELSQILAQCTIGTYAGDKCRSREQALGLVFRQ